MPTHSTPSTRPASRRRQEPATLPAIGFVREPQVLAVIPISKSTLWRRVKHETFPRPVKLSERVTAWRAEDLHSWIEHHADD